MAVCTSAAVRNDPVLVDVAYKRPGFEVNAHSWAQVDLALRIEWWLYLEDDPLLEVPLTREKPRLLGN